MKLGYALLSVVLSGLLLTSGTVMYAADKALIIEDTKNMTGSEENDAGAHLRAVELAREQKFSDSLTILSRLYQDRPEYLPVLFDYIAVLNWSGQNQLAVEIYEHNKPVNAPAYVLQSVGGAYFRLHKYRQAEAIYAQLAQSGDMRAKQWQAETLLKMGDKQISKGLKLYSELLQTQPDTADLAVENARTMMAAGRTDVARRLFELVINKIPDNYQYRRAYADSLRDAGLYRRAFDEYSQLLGQKEFKAAGLAGVAETAIRIGAYDKAESALSLMAESYGREATSQRALATYDDRYQGSADTAFSLYDSYDKTYSSLWQMSADQHIGGATSALVQVAKTRLGDDNIGANADLNRYSAGLSHTGINSDVRLWYDQYQTNRSENGYRLNSRYFVSDQNVVAFDISRAPVVDLDTLRANESPLLMNTNYNLSFSRNIGRDKQLYASMAQGRYSDGNSSESYGLQFSRTMVETDSQSLQYSVYWNRTHWSKVSDWYGNPLASKSFGTTLNYRVNDGNGYWSTGLNSVWGADDNNPLEFWPSLQLEYGYRYTPHHSLVIGTSYGLRTDKASELEGLSYNYRQFSLSYRADW